MLLDSNCESVKSRCLFFVGFVLNFEFIPTRSFLGISLKNRNGAKRWRLGKFSSMREVYVPWNHTAQVADIRTKLRIGVMNLYPRAPSSTRKLQTPTDQ